MKLLSLNRADAANLMWQRQSTGVYIDADGFNEITIIATEDGMGGEVATTVLFAGTPVLVVRSGDSSNNPTSLDNWRHELPMYGRDSHGPDAQALAAFLVAIGEADEEAPARVAERGINTLEESDDYGDGHELVAFVGSIARATHRAFPDDTPEAKGW